MYMNTKILFTILALMLVVGCSSNGGEDIASENVSEKVNLEITYADEGETIIIDETKLSLGEIKALMNSMEKRDFTDLLENELTYDGSVMDKTELTKDEKALNEALKIFETLFGDDCSAYTDYLGDEIYHILEGESNSKRVEKKIICREFDYVHDDFTFKDFTQTHKFMVYDKKKFDLITQLFPGEVSIKLEEHDYVVGIAYSKIEIINDNSLLDMIIRNTEDGWKIVGLE